jgi:hypothetical protein
VLSGRLLIHAENYIGQYGYEAAEDGPRADLAVPLARSMT